MLPGHPYGSGRAMEQLERDGSADTRDCGSNGRCSHQSHHVTQLVQSEVWTKVAVDEPRSEHGFTGIAQAEQNGAPDTSVAKQVCQDCGSQGAENDRPPGPETESDQGARGHSCGWPKNGHAFWLGQQCQAQPRCNEIDNTNRSRERDRAHPLRQIEISGQLVLNLGSWVLQHSTPLLQSSCQRRV